MYHCDFCNKVIKLKSKNKLLKSNTHIELEKSVHATFSIENPNFFVIDDTYNEYINIHNTKKLFLYSEM